MALISRATPRRQATATFPRLRLTKISATGWYGDCRTHPKEAKMYIGGGLLALLLIILLLILIF